MRMNLTAACGLALALGLALPLHAQEEPAAEVVPVYESDASEESVPAEAPVEEAPADESAAAPAEEAPVEEAAAEPEEPAEPLALYVGADYVLTTLSLSTPAAAGASQLDSGMYRGRVGMRALEAIGLEAQFGLDNSDDEPGSVETKGYYGVFIVPTATVFEVAELAFPVGYAQSTFDNGGNSQDFRSIAYGIDAELPIRTFGESLPDLRLTAGWMVYYQKSDARAYGGNLGLRYDFQTGALKMGNPFAGVGSFVAGLWPFGDDEAAAEAPAE